MATGANERAACLSVSIKRCLILDLKIGVSFVYATLPCMKFHIHASSEMTMEKGNPLSLSLHPCLPSPACCLPPPSSSGCPARPGGMLTSFDQVFIISDCDACLSEAKGPGGGKNVASAYKRPLHRGLKSRQASRLR